jgi:hypothetical protein
MPAGKNRLPAIAIGNLDERGLAPRSHQRNDTPEGTDGYALDRAVELGLALVDAIDAALDPEPAASDAASDTTSNTTSDATEAATPA